MPMHTRCNGGNGHKLLAHAGLPYNAVSIHLSNKLTDADIVDYFMMLILQVTKVRYFHKPTYETLRSSLCALRDHCVSSEVRKLCMPRIGCGLDKLKWERVVAVIQEVFADVDMAITVYYL